jgi:hypothetical protein
MKMHQMADKHRKRFLIPIIMKKDMQIKTAFSYHHFTPLEDSYLRT